MRILLPSTALNAALFGSTAEITTFSDVIVVYKFLGDLMFYVTGSQDENELILYQVLQGFYESISLLLRCSTLAPCLAFAVLLLTCVFNCLQHLSDKVCLLYSNNNMNPM